MSAKVQILLSTYNGTAHLRQQMESLLSQDYPVDVLARDDGSSDGTADLLREYEAARSNVRVVVGENLGFVQSFFQLLEMSGEADYFAFCDQDDCWQASKISSAIETLNRQSNEIPHLYCSRLAVVDENLKLLRYTNLPRKPLSFRNALVECPLQGCTVVLNRAARSLLLRELPRYAYSHDWWAYLVVSAFGSVIYDAKPKILYRQHAFNVFGVSDGVLDHWKTKGRRFHREGKLRLVSRQAEEFRRIYGPLLDRDKQQILGCFLESRKQLWHRLYYAARRNVYRQARLDHLALKILIALDSL